MTVYFSHIYSMRLNITGKLYICSQTLVAVIGLEPTFLRFRYLNHLRYTAINHSFNILLAHYVIKSSTIHRVCLM